MLPDDVRGGISRSRAPENPARETPVLVTSVGPADRPTSKGPIVPLAEVERNAIESALRAFHGSVPDAAFALQVSQATIYRKLKAFGIDRRDFL